MRGFWGSISGDALVLNWVLVTEVGPLCKNWSSCTLWFIHFSACILYINKMLPNKTCEDFFTNPHSSNLTSSLNLSLQSWDKINHFFLWVPMAHCTFLYYVCHFRIHVSALAWLSVHLPARARLFATWQQGAPKTNALDGPKEAQNKCYWMSFSKHGGCASDNSSVSWLPHGPWQLAEVI